MSFFFNRGRNRTNAAELARQTYDLLARLDVANNPNPKVEGGYENNFGRRVMERMLILFSYHPPRLTRPCRNASPR
jgi:hypothetical protein